MNTLSHDLIIWVVIYIAAWGIFELLKRIEIDEVKNPWITAAYFLNVTVIVGTVSFNAIKPLVTDFTWTPIVWLIIALIAEAGTIYYGQNYIKKPDRVLKKFGHYGFLQISYKYMFSKFFSTLFQQIMILILILTLNNHGFATLGVMGIFILLFAIMHVPTLWTMGSLLGKAAIISSVVAGIFFPLIIMQAQYGFVYTFLLHNLYWGVFGTLFWMYSPEID